MYAVVAPGYQGIHPEIVEVKELLKIMPYLQFSKVKDEEEGFAYIRSHQTHRRLESVRDYGSTFPLCHVVMEYIIGLDGNLYYNFDTSKFGYVRIVNDKAVLDQRPDRISAMLDNYVVDRNRISSHLVAIKAGLELIGELVDVEVLIPDYSIFYALRSYTGSNRFIKKIHKYLDERAGEVSITIRR